MRCPKHLTGTNSNHGPVSKDLLFSNWLLTYLAGNHQLTTNAVDHSFPDRLVQNHKRTSDNHLVLIR
jgi:hypothetical protein